MSNAERAETYELSHKLFIEILGDKLLEMGIGINSAEEKALFFKGTNVYKGDVNFDGRRNAKDIIAIQKYMLDQNKASDLQFYLADYNNDGRVNAKDIIAIQKAMLG